MTLDEIKKLCDGFDPSRAGHILAVRRLLPKLLAVVDVARTIYQAYEKNQSGPPDHYNVEDLRDVLEALEPL